MAAKIEPMSNRKLKRSITRQRVLLALYVHTPRYEFIGSATHKTLMAEVGIGIDRLKTALDELEQLGFIKLCGCGQGGNEYLLIGHPDVPDYWEYLHARFRPQSWSPDWRDHARAKRGELVARYGENSFFHCERSRRGQVSPGGFVDGPLEPAGARSDECGPSKSGSQAEPEASTPHGGHRTSCRDAAKDAEIEVSDTL